MPLGFRVFNDGLRAFRAFYGLGFLTRAFRVWGFKML